MNPFVGLIPRGWYAEEALAAVRVLRQIIEAIWEVHGEQMVEAVAVHPDRWPVEDLVDMPEIDEDDIPF